MDAARPTPNFDLSTQPPRLVSNTRLIANAEDAPADVLSVNSNGEAGGFVFHKIRHHSAQGQEREVVGGYSIDHGKPFSPIRLMADHRHHRCDTSCNKCLRDFNNLQYHGLLDWRLALDMARLALDPHATIDMGSDRGPFQNAWKPLCDGPTSVVASMMTKLGYNTPVRLGGLWTFVNASPSKAWVVCHPLWTERHATFQAAKAAVIAAHPNLGLVQDGVGRLNPFRALRRIADYIA